MSSPEQREARQMRQHKADRSYKRRRGVPQSAQELFGPSRAQRERDQWSEEFTGIDPRDETYFVDEFNVLDFNDE
jgi:hypothetical protein